MKSPLEPAVAALIQRLRAEAPTDRDAVPVPQQRRSSDDLLTALAGTPPPCHRVQDIELAGAAGPLRGRAYFPDLEQASYPTLLFFHGGGFVIGNLETHEVLARHLATRAGCLVVAVDYRLAPEFPYPAAHSDARAAAGWLLDGAGGLPVDRDRLAVFGDSAGGNLALAACRQLRRQGARPRLRVLAYPVVDIRGNTEAHHRHADDGFLTAEATWWFLEQLLPSRTEPDIPELCPVLARDLAESPPTLLILAEVDPLVDDGRAYAAALRAAGAAVEVVEYLDQTHGFLGMAAITPRALEGLQLCARSLRSALDAVPR